MGQRITTGSILTGKVTGIQPYGAFVSLNDSIQGLVHISEITHGYVKDINDHVKIGDEVTVKVLSVDEEGGKVSLSIRATEGVPSKKIAAKVKKAETNNEQGFNTLKEKLQEWIEQSESEGLMNK
ncbi:general stress protein 13 [Bacillus aquiflavi]|uniref:General stress protein 13 n=1 Tax=Bacillus aquiflavi TaxID=2672567 RepID=A0A6B3VQ34_9BACI|nr:S1 domain-containing post-transcriptional regulator GSP13 [Bacillus aquiflavi]MBA4536046.1 general stress protein 13 [Bacillus aquiflavi]NEY80420.1 general stress protein 13 [Bacillus aquiflavi]UAC47673.1 general stress protein 13 [Bacillus aquiflavi]